MMCETVEPSASNVLEFKPPWQPTTNKLSVIDKDLAYQVLRFYFFKTSRFKDEKDLVYDLKEIQTDNMYITKSNSPGKKIKAAPHKKSIIKEIQDLVNAEITYRKPVHTFEMNHEFIDRLDDRTPNQLVIKWIEVKMFLDNFLVDRHRARIYWFLYREQKLSSHDPKLEKFQSVIDGIKNDDTRRNQLTQAIKALIKVILDNQK